MTDRVLLAALMTTCALSLSMAEAAEPTSRMLIETKDISDLAISPDGSYLTYRVEQASLARNSYDSTWYIRQLGRPESSLAVADGGVPVRGVAGLSIVEPPIWSPDSRWIFFRALIDGRVSVWRSARDGHRAERLTPELADVFEFHLSGDGRYLHYVVGPDLGMVVSSEDAEAESGILIDQTIVPGQGLFRAASVNERPTTQKQAGWAGRQGVLGTTFKRVVDLSDGTVTDDPIIGDNGLSDKPNRAISMSVDLGDGVRAELRRVGSDPALRDPPCQDIVYVKAGRERLAPWRHGDDCQAEEVASILALPQSDQIAFTVTAYRSGLGQSLRVWDIIGGKIRVLHQGHGLLAGSRNPNTPCVASPIEIVCVASAASEPPRLVAINLKDGHETVLADPNADTREVYQPARLMNWTGKSGRSYSGWFLKSTSSRAPLVIAYNSCPGFLRGGAGDEWPLAILAARGISALCINRPFGYPTDPKVRYGYGLDAVEGAIGQLGIAGEIDPHRVGMGGLSFGSEVVMWTLMKSNLIAAASVSSPMTTPLAYTLRSLQGETYWRELKASWGLEAPDATPEGWQQISPALNIDKLTTPLLLQMPEQEYWGALEYYIPLRNKGAPTELYAFPQAPHNKVQPRQKLAAYDRNIDWFRFWLSDYEDPDISKAAQYSRWRALKANRGRPASIQ
jgi:dipeptidyl aminopeptidase/acylaminoacyl peptidase